MATRPICSEITRIEVLQGIRDRERRSTEELFQVIRWMSVDERIARLAGELGQRWAGSHRGIDLADLVVAATAQALDADVATSNIRHFPMFPGLRSPY